MQSEHVLEERKGGLQIADRDPQVIENGSHRLSALSSRLSV
jgi:hypothetical protein